MSHMIGSISYGTHRPADLIPAFLDAIKELDEDMHNEIMRSNETEQLVAMVADLDQGYITDDGPEIREIEAVYNQSFDDQVSWLLNDILFPTLEELAPEGTYFGAHEGDGADFGFWPVDPDE